LDELRTFDNFTMMTILMDALNFVVETFNTLVAEGKSYVFLLPIYTIMLSAEFLATLFVFRKKWDYYDSTANLAITIFHLLKDLFLGAIVPVAIMYFIYQNFRVFTLPLTWVGFVGTFLLYDLVWYIDHCIAHRTGLFWAFHSVHHSSKEYNFTVASRGFFLDSMLCRPLFYLLPVLGVSPFQYIAYQIISNIFGIFQHTRLINRMGWIDHILATPSNHRVHHGANLKYLDKNYGEVLMLWDKLWGSYQKEEEEPVYGLTTNIDTYNPIKIELAGIQWLRAQMATADRWQDKLKYLYKPPGWRHDGVGSSTEEMRGRADKRGKLEEEKFITDLSFETEFAGESR